MLADHAPEVEAFDWQAPAATPTDDPMPTALVPMAQLQAAQALLQDAQRREMEAHARLEAREREFQERINALERELGKAEGKLEGFEAAQTQQRRPWWARLFGSGE